MSRSGKPLALSTFTGAGGLDLGLEEAGFEVLACVESDATARETLRENRSEWKLLDPCDIVELAPTLCPEDLDLEPGELDLIAGGPPCQTFSKAAQWSKNGRAGLCGECENAIDALLTIMGRFRPRALLLENVPGFVRGDTDAATYLREFFKQLNESEGTDYNLQFRIDNAADFGVPQRRERAIVIAFRDGSSFPWPTPTHRENPVRAWDALADVNTKNPPKLTGKWADLVPSIPEGKNYQWHTARGGGRELFGYRRRFWSFLLKLAKDETSWTLPAQPGPSTGPFHWDNRPLSIEERLRLQAFPSSWKVAGNFREQMRQVGNATPPLLAEIYGRALLQHLYRYEYNDKPSLLIERRASVPAPRVPAPVPPKYLHLEGDHDPHPGQGKGPQPIKKDVSDE